MEMPPILSNILVGLCESGDNTVRREQDNCILLIDYDNAYYQ